MRGVLGVVTGLVAGIVAMIVIAIVGGLIFPGATPTEGFTAQAAVAAFPGLPAGAKAFIILSWLGGAITGSAVAKRIARAGWAAWTVAILFAIYVLLTVMILPMPAWMQAVSVAAPLFGGLLGNHLAAGRAPAEAETEAVDAGL